MSRRGSISDSDSGEEMGFGLGDIMPREPSPEPIPFSYATYELPEWSGLKTKTGGTEVSIRLVGAHPLWGHHLWNTARVTTTYLLQHAPTLLQGRRILELGAGGALPSVACALAGAQVVATDYADASLMENIEFNMRANLDDAAMGRAVAVGHTWGKDVGDVLAARPAAPAAAAALPEGSAQSSGDGRFDVVILSDLMFNHSQHDALIATLDKTLSLAVSAPTADLAPMSTSTPEGLGNPQTPCALVFFTCHRPWLKDADMAFFPRLAASGNWAYERVCELYYGPMFEDDPGDEVVRGTVHGFRCWRTRPSAGKAAE